MSTAVSRWIAYEILSGYKKNKRTYHGYESSVGIHCVYKQGVGKGGWMRWEVFLGFFWMLDSTIQHIVCCYWRGGFTCLLISSLCIFRFWHLQKRRKEKRRKRNNKKSFDWFQVVIYVCIHIYISILFPVLIFRISINTLPSLIDLYHQQKGNC